MKNIEEQADSSVLLDDQAVSDYLRQNPDFFIRNARAVEQMAVPHPVRGSVSLVEWHMARQRNHIQRLEEEITLLMEQASANHELFDRLLSLKAIWPRLTRCRICSTVCIAGRVSWAWRVPMCGCSVINGCWARPPISFS